MNNWDYGQAVPTSPWRSAMTVPRTLRLVDTAAGFRLLTEPVDEFRSLRRRSVSIADQLVENEVDLSRIFPFALSQVDVELEFDLARTDASEFGVMLANAEGERYRIGYDVERRAFVSDRSEAGDDSFSDAFAERVHEAPRQSDSPLLAIRLLIDVASIEVFADAGATVLTDTFFPSSTFDSIMLYAREGEALIVSGDFHELGSIW